MSYCSICGISCQSDERVCVDCSSELGDGLKRAEESQPENGNAETVKRKAMNEPGGFGMGTDQTIESQLGRGLIKPHSIELEIDGYHFKYDKPARNVDKLEKFKEKIVEFRVTCPDPDIETSREERPVEEISAVEMPPQETIQENPALESIAGEPECAKEAAEKNTENEAENTIPGSDSEPVDIETVDHPTEDEGSTLDQAIWESGEFFDETEMDSPVKPIPDFGTPETEMDMDGEMVVLWEDSQHWFGIPLANQYRISNCTLQINERLAHKFSELDLELISEVVVRQSWLDKLFKTGDLLISVKNLPETTLKLAGIRNPEQVRRLLNELISIIPDKSI